MSQWFSASSLENGHSSEAQGSFPVAAVTGIDPGPPFASHGVLEVGSSEAGGGAAQDVFKDGCHPKKAGVLPGFEILSKSDMSTQTKGLEFLISSSSYSIPRWYQWWNPSSITIQFASAAICTIHDCKRSLGSGTIGYHWPVHTGHSAEARPAWQASHSPVNAPLGT